jgi:DNA-directed RNA polymerase subunit beta'
MTTTTEILEFEKIGQKVDDLNSSFDYLKILIASPVRMKSWAERTLPTGEIVGEILRSGTINFRTHEPETYGLFCEKIFGPLKNWKCKCGKYNGFVLNKICEDCNVEIIEARVRRYRMGYIELTCPIAHLWYFKAQPNYLHTILTLIDPNITKLLLEKIIYFRESSESTESEFVKRFSYYMNDKDNEIQGFFKKPTKHSSLATYTGADLIKTALDSIDLKDAIRYQREFVEPSSFLSQAVKRDPKVMKMVIRRIRILESFFSTKVNLSWMILRVLPVLPPSLRPLLELETGRLVSADVNEIYRLIITRNLRLFEFRSLFVPDLIILQGKKLLQESVDSLIDNARVSKERQITLNNKALKSLTEILEGKQGRFRQSLLGKRVDYSARSVIVVGPLLKLNQFGLPYQIAVELFQPFLINELLKTKIKAPSYNTKLAHIILKKNKPFVWTLLKELVKKHSLLLNRAPTLHRFGIQAFDPILVLGQAIHLHPLVCTGFNADFDGDQMAIHLPLYEASQLEVRTMMRPTYNVLSPANGEVILKPTQDMVIGCYYLTLMVIQNKQNIQKWFSNEDDALKAFYQKKINIHTPILVRYKIYNLNFDIENNVLKFNKSKINGFLKEQNIIIYKKFQVGNLKEKFYLISNVGILIAHKKLSKTQQISNLEYQLTDFFLETSPGRLIFSRNFKNALE